MAENEGAIEKSLFFVSILLLIIVLGAIAGGVYLGDGSRFAPAEKRMDCYKRTGDLSQCRN